MILLVDPSGVAARKELFDTSWQMNVKKKGTTAQRTGIGEKTGDTVRRQSGRCMMSVRASWPYDYAGDEGCEHGTRVIVEMVWKG
jgi:hypothetical protein